MDPQSPPTLFRRVLSRVLSPLTGGEGDSEQDGPSIRTGADRVSRGGTRESTEEKEEKGDQQGQHSNDSSSDSSDSSGDEDEDEEALTNTYDAIKVIGHGSFGCVFLARLVEHQADRDDRDTVVAIKKVRQDRTFKNRELQIMKTLSKAGGHPCIVGLKNYFYSGGTGAAATAAVDAAAASGADTGKLVQRRAQKKKNAGTESDADADADREEGDMTRALLAQEKAGVDLYLNLVLEYVPDTLHSVCRQYTRAKKRVPLEHTRLYAFQLARALAHLHALGICHRDVKPQNLLVDTATCTLKLCDFGSSKCLVRGEPNVAYICSRYYRAPELIFGSNDYTCIVDMWSFACVLAELLLGSPLFPSATSADHLVEVIKVLGTPSREALKYMNPSYIEFQFPNIQAHVLSTLFPPGTDPHALQIVEDSLRWIPHERPTAIQTLVAPFFLPALAPRGVAPVALIQARSLPSPLTQTQMQAQQGAAGSGKNEAPKTLPFPKQLLQFSPEELAAAGLAGGEYLQALNTAAAASSSAATASAAASAAAKVPQQLKAFKCESRA